MATLTAADLAKLPDSAFAYIDSRGGRHLPLNDAEHVRAALARYDQTHFESGSAKIEAWNRILAAARKFGVTVSKESGRSAGSSDEIERRRMVKGEREQRTVSSGIELRDDGGSHVVQLVGMPIVYDTDYPVTDALGTFTERMARGVVSDLLADGVDCRFMVNHGAGGSLPLARTTSGTLRLEDTPKGLRCVADVDVRSSLATDLVVAVERGDITQMSVAMRVAADTWDARGERRTIHKLSALEDVSPVVYPASPSTSISLKRSQSARTTRAVLAAEYEALAERQARRSLDRIRFEAEVIEARRAHRAPRAGRVPADPALAAEIEQLERAIQRARTWGVSEDVASLRQRLTVLRGY